MPIPNAEYYRQNNIHLENIGQNVLRALLQDERMVVYVVPSNKREVIDVWSASVLDTVEHWRNGESRQRYPYIAMYDFSQLGLMAALTPYFRQKAEAMAERHPHNFGRYGIILARGTMIVMVLNMLNRILKPKQPDMQGRIFHDPAAAMPWLVEAIHMDWTNLRTADQG